jgi:hypothetical protein
LVRTVAGSPHRLFDVYDSIEPLRQMRMTRGARVSSGATATCVTPRRISTALQQQFHGCLVPARCCTHQGGHAAEQVRLTLLPQVARSWQKCPEPGFFPEKRQCKQFGCSATVRHIVASLAAREARRRLCRLLARPGVSQRGINSKWLLDGCRMAWRGSFVGREAEDEVDNFWNVDTAPRSSAPSV